MPRSPHRRPRGAGASLELLVGFEPGVDNLPVWCTGVGHPSRWPTACLSVVIVAVAVKSGPNHGNTPRTAGPIRRGTGPSDRASRSKQLLVAVDDAVAALDVRLRREPAATLTCSLERTSATRGRDWSESCCTSLLRHSAA